MQVTAFAFLSMRVTKTRQLKPKIAHCKSWGLYLMGLFAKIDECISIESVHYATGKSSTFGVSM